MNNHIYRLVAGVSFILVLAFALFLPTMKTSSQAGAKCYRFYGVVKSHEDFHQVIDIEFYDGDTLLDRIQTQATTSSFASRYYRVYDEFRVVVTFNPAAADDDERVNLTYGPTADIECGIKPEPEPTPEPTPEVVEPKPTTLPDEKPVIRDGRLNNGVGEFGAPLAAYCEAGGVSVWDIDGEGQGSFAFVASAEAISAGLAAAVASGENVLIAEGLGNSLYALASGELSMVGSYLDEPFKQYQFIADSAVCG